MRTNQIKIDLEESKSTTSDFLLFENIITDRGSKYSVSGGRVKNREDIRNFLKKLKAKKKYAKATHNTYAVRISDQGRIFELKNDDGETGAGNTILRVLQKEMCVDTIVVVTRWFGGIKLQGDRFRHVQDATRYFMNQLP